MGDWRVGIVHRAWAMHKRWRPNCRLARITEVNVTAEIVCELLRKRKRKFIEQIVRMLSIMERLIVPRFAALQEKRITAALLGHWIETHHRAQTKLSVFA